MCMGCKCHEKICQRCFKAGDVRKCPMCRKGKAHPNVDRKWLRRKWKAAGTQPCLGCDKAVAYKSLHKHENKCIKYRNWIDELYEEDARMRRIQADKHAKAVTEMEERIDIQAEMIDELESQIEEMEDVCHEQDEELKTYSMEQTRLLRTLDSLAGPLCASIRQLDNFFNRISSARSTLRSSTARHLSRQTQGAAASSVVETEAAAGPDSPPQSPAQQPPPPLHQRVRVTTSRPGGSHEAEGGDA